MEEVPGRSPCTSYINETDGSVSTYQYAGVTFKLVNAGVWKGESSVKQKLEFFAVSRSRI